MNINTPFVIAIDGPAASGKGSLARKLAAHYDFDFLDTGTLYRRVALAVINADIRADDIEAIINKAGNLAEELDKPYDDDALRSDGVGSMASIVAQIPQVREILFQYQRQFAAKAVKGAVLDGRDIGTKICPDADIKLFVTASLEKRAERRSKELISRGIEGMYAQVLAEMQERDERDSPRLKEHMAPEHDAILIDTSDMTPQEVIDKSIGIIDQKYKSRA